jgi:tetratricopeptide (TPR) repeat protein
MEKIQFLRCRSVSPLLQRNARRPAHSIFLSMPGFFLLTIALTHPSIASAGLYNTAEPDEGSLDPNYLKFGETLNVLRSIGADKVEVERPLRKRYLLQADLFTKLDLAKLSAEEKLNMSAVLIRRRRFSDAIQLLMPATRQHPDMFLLQANLATAYHQNGDNSRARDTIKDCLDAWPKQWQELSDGQRAFLMSIGWNEGPFGFYREVETYYYKLLKLRSRKAKAVDAIDALFDVKFVGDSGEFEPGTISKAEKAKLPRNARQIVEQLLVWLPYDLRLQWLLGEILNAQGEAEDVKAARKIFDTLVSLDGMRAKELMARRQALNSRNEPAATAVDPTIDADQKDKPAATLDWRGLVVAFVAGIIVAIFTHWQYREIQRRRQK